METNGNIVTENNKLIKHYNTKNEKDNKEKNKDKMMKHEKSKSFNYNIVPSNSMTNSYNKSQKYSSSFSFQKYISDKTTKNSKDNNNKNNINISYTKSSSNYDICKNKNLSKNKSKNIKKSDIASNNNSLEDLFDNELKNNNFKNPEEYHFLYIKIFQACNEIRQNFENEGF